MKGKGHGEKFSRKKEAAILSLLTHNTISEAAHACGVGEVTLWRWLQNPEFQEAYRQAKREAFSQAISRLQAESGKAVATLVEIATTGQKESARVMAARTILELAVRAVEVEELEERVSKLEAMLEGDRGWSAN